MTDAAAGILPPEAEITHPTGIFKNLSRNKRFASAVFPVIFTGRDLIIPSRFAFAFFCGTFSISEVAFFKHLLYN